MIINFPKSFTKMIRKILVFILILLSNKIVESQPIYNRSAKINNIFFNKDTLYFEYNGLFINNCVNIIDYKGFKNTTLPYTCEDSDISNFIYNGDTMIVKLNYFNYDWNKIVIDKMYFIKGEFNIDFYKCKENIKKNMKEGQRPIIIENFPCDCLEYRIEGD